MNSQWTDQDVATLKRLFHDGFSAAGIGKAVNRTRNAVIGKLYRLKLSYREGFTSSKDKKASKPIKTNSPRRPLVIPVFKAEAAAKAPLPVKIDPVQSLHIPFAETGKFQCLWIDDDTYGASATCCGNRIPGTPGRPYCEFHRHLSKGVGTLGERTALRVLKSAIMAEA